MNRSEGPDRKIKEGRYPVAPTPSILIVDADADTRRLHREFLDVSKCDVIEVSDGREALLQALIRPPILVITEIRLRFIDGYALCEILRRDRTTADTPILVVTSD